MLRGLHISLRLALVAALFSLGAFAEDRYVVKVTGDINGIAQKHGLKVVGSLTGSASGHFVLASSHIDPAAILRSLRMEFAVQTAETDSAVQLPGITAKAQVHPASFSASSRMSGISSSLVSYYTTRAASAYVSQPAGGVINLAKAHTLANGDGTVIATIDTGADLFHPVLAGTIMPGWDFIHGSFGGMERADKNAAAAPLLAQETTPILDQETTPILDGGTAMILLQQETTPILDQETTPILDSSLYPAYGHGTMVAGLLHLVAPKARILPLRTFAADGSSTISQIVQALHYAADMNVDVVNMSFSVSTDSPALKNAINYAASRGLVLVAAAGNDGQATQVWPASYQSVIGVGSTNNFDIRSLFSNYGNSLVTLAAPGEGLITIYPYSHYAQVWGTSFSSPLVAGGAALLLDIDSKLNRTIVGKDLSNATYIGQELGAGELDLYQACLSVKNKDN